MLEKSPKEARSASRAKTDAELVKQLKTASGGEKLVEAVVRLRPDHPSQIVPAAARTEELTNHLLERVRKQSGQSESRHNVFRNLGSFVVSAPSTFIQQLMHQPEVASVVANRQPGSALIAPIRKAAGRSVSKRKSTVMTKSKPSRTVSKKSARKVARKSTK